MSDNLRRYRAIRDALTAMSHRYCENMSPIFCEYPTNTGYTSYDHVADCAHANAH
jgi:hypothetical protein